MLSRPGCIKLCEKCRFDILSIFTTGACAPNSVRQRPKPTIRSLQKVTARRLFASKSSLYQYKQDPEPEELQSVRNDDGNSNVDTASIEDQLAALKELERVLGRNIEDAIEEDKSLDLLSQRHNSLDVLRQTSTSSQTRTDRAKETVATLRQNGADASDLAREARHLLGDSLPEGVLHEQEVKIYKRLYGDPEPEISQDSENLEDLSNELLDQKGQRVEYRLPKSDNDEVKITRSKSQGADTIEETAAWMSMSESAQSRARAIAESLGAEFAEPEEEPLINPDEEEGDDGEPYERMHPLTKLGQFKTFPSTIFLPKEAYLDPVQNMMGDYSNKHLKQTSEKIFGGPGLPDSPLTPRSGRVRPQNPIPLQASQHTMSPMEANTFMTVVMPPTYAAIMSVLVETRKRLGFSWLNDLMAKKGGPRILDVGGGGASILAWREIVKAHWESLHDSDHPSPPPPASKSVVLTGSDALRYRAAALLENTTFVPRLPDYVHSRDGPTLEDDRPAQPRKQFDIVIAPHTLLVLEEEWMKKQHVQNLWSLLNPDGGILILIEKGLPRGFEAIAGARDLLLQRYIANPEGEQTSNDARQDEESLINKATGMIIAPCTNHEKCPMYTTSGVSHGRFDYCAFQQRYQRPTHLQRVLGATIRNHDNVDFSYVSVMKGKDLRQRQISNWDDLRDPSSAPFKTSSSQKTSTTLSTDEWTDQCRRGFSDITPETISSSTSDTSTLPIPFRLPRLIYPPLKPRGHVILDLCTPAGKIERWTVPRSQSKQAFRDARKAQHGDLWALGAKTRVARNLKLGGKKGAKEAMRGKERRIKEQAEHMLEEMEEEKLREMEEEEELEREIADAEDDVFGSEDRDRLAFDIGSTDAQDLEQDGDSEEVRRLLSEWEGLYQNDRARSAGKSEKTERLASKKRKNRSSKR